MHFAIACRSLDAYDHAERRSKPLEAYSRRACPLRVGIGVAIVGILVLPFTVDKCLNGIPLYIDRLAALVERGRSGERPLALDLVRARLGLRSAASDDQHVRRGQFAEVAGAIDIAVPDNLFVRKDAVVEAVVLDRPLEKSVLTRIVAAYAVSIG